ncbi:ankyrin repeat domain-containing protein 13B-like [Watersipora subatra]|uniref:ankyrin repeat domain-containing protein 13B-like n=1 Tax=Watersipora subatra TaxID=2589382 RepID=UPI00355AEDB2
MAASQQTASPEQQYPIHWSVWHNNLRTLTSQLESKQYDLEEVDPRGRTPLHLAISMGHVECAKSLLRHGADANKENARYWTALHEATCTGDPELVQCVLQHRDYQRFMNRTDGIPALLKKIQEAPDFYVEMTWEFTSWVPLVSRMCPSDTYKVYKNGSMVRIDTTLLGFDNTKWERGSRSYVFKAEEACAKVLEIDHDAKVVYSETIKEITHSPNLDLLLPSSDQVSARLTAPVITTYINTEKIEFERVKAGVWGFRSDKVETVNGYECKVFNASNVQFITKTRTEHLTAQDKKQMKKNKTFNPLESMLGMAEKHSEKSPHAGAECIDINNPCSITAEEYFDSSVDLEDRDIGRPRETTTKVQKFKANLSLCHDYPLTLQEQVLPIIDLMAATSAHFRKLKEFITLQLPAGFPVKIEIPIYHILNAKITFGNIFSSDTPVPRVSVIKDTLQRENEDGVTVFETVVTSCAVDDTVFDVPTGYRVIGEGSHHEDRYMDQDDQLLQFAIQQSLSDTEPSTDQPGDLNFVEALQTFSKESHSPHPERRAVHLNRTMAEQDFETQLNMALQMSTQQANTRQPTQEELERREQEELEKILALSLVEK